MVVQFIKRSFGQAWAATNRLLIRAASRPSELKSIVTRAPDLHAVPRIVAIKSVFGRVTPTIEAGAADGWLSIELAPYFRTPITALAYTEAEHEAMRRNIRVLGLEGIMMAGIDDAQTLATLKDGSVGQVLLIDVLEHVADDIAAIGAARRVLRTGGRFVISVPTPNYPYWFGEDFDSLIGHRRHFTREALEAKLREQGFDIEDYFYYTPAASGRLMKLWYRDLKAWPKEYMPSGWRTKITGILATIILPVLSILSLKLESYDKVIDGHASLLMVGVKRG
jgi:SAM-dependent methyltransferase